MEIEDFLTVLDAATHLRLVHEVPPLGALVFERAFHAADLGCEALVVVGGVFLGVTCNAPLLAGRLGLFLIHRATPVFDWSTGRDCPAMTHRQLMTIVAYIDK
jgi:hypothetical protein